MTRKTQYSILILLIIGLGIFLWRDKADHVQYQLPSIDPVPTSTISQITLTQGDDSLVVRKDDGQWTIPPRGYPASQGQVERILKALSDLQLTALVSESKHYERYDLDAQQAIEVTARGQDTLLRRFSVGKAASNYQSTYVRLPDDPNVYLAKSNLRSALDVDVTSLQDKTVLSFAPDHIQDMKIQTTNGTAHFTLQTNSQDANGTRWVTAQNHDANATLINKLTTQLSGLKCAQYIDDKEKDDFASPKIWISLHGENDHELQLFAQDGVETKELAGISSDNPFPFRLSAYNSKQITERTAKLVTQYRTSRDKKD
jgi:hypothetical protein